jgi:hypothetical protein
MEKWLNYGLDCGIWYFQRGPALVIVPELVFKDRAATQLILAAVPYPLPIAALHSDSILDAAKEPRWTMRDCLCLQTRRWMVTSWSNPGLSSIAHTKELTRTAQQHFPNLGKVWNHPRSAAASQELHPGPSDSAGNHGFLKTF